MSLAQISCLIDFMEGQQELAFGRSSRSKEGRNMAKRLWQKCATILNNVSKDCVQKSPEQWRLFYNEYKHKVVKKIKNANNEKIATGGVPSSKLSLTPLQERLYNLLERDTGSPKVRQKRILNTTFDSSGNESGDDSNQCADPLTPASHQPVTRNESDLRTNSTFTHGSDDNHQNQTYLYGDEFKIYGEYVASQLRQLSTEESLLAREKIQSVLTQSRLKDLQRNKSDDSKYSMNGY